ncbi:MAG TPA: hypothetical protein VGS11_10220 [Candidatus Bathyarchaeia archaeon]|nr:hypothetical protein [Candidatus Bathyarchaeia archaeon]
MRTKEKVAVLFAALILLLPIAASAFTGPISLTDPNWTVSTRVTTNGSEITKTSSPATQTAILLSFPFANADSGATGSAYTSFLLDKISLSLSSSNTITATFDVPATLATLATFVGNPNGNACGPSTSVRLFFQSTGTGNPGSITGPAPNNGGFETKFWWSNTGTVATTVASGSHYNFVNGGTGGTITLSVPLNGADWSDFYGHFGTGSYGANFNAALGAISFIGLSFGSGCFFANGVGVTGGSATFELTSYTIS